MSLRCLSIRIKVFFFNRCASIYCDCGGQWVNKLAVEADILADMEMDLGADMEMYMVADIEEDKVADMGEGGYFRSKTFNCRFLVQIFARSICNIIY